jgi:hypothetical protein
VFWHPAYLSSVCYSLAYAAWLKHYEQKWFGCTLKSPTSLFFRTLFLGAGAGLFVSFCLLVSDWGIGEEEWLFVLGCMALLAIAGFRFVCLAYSVGLLSLASLFLRIFPLPPVGAPWNQLIGHLQHFSIGYWLWLVGILHLLEWFLIRLDGAYGAYPIIAERAGGQEVNGLMLQQGWPVPLLLFHQAHPFALPVFLSFSSVTLSKPLKQQKRLVSTLTLLYGLGLCAILGLMRVWDGAVWIAAAFALMAHEMIYQWGRMAEKRREPIYVSDQKGMKVLAVVPGSPAAEMGLKRGDIIQRFNGSRIRTMEDLIRCSENATFCKLEVLDERNDHHIMQKVLYEDDPRHLGVVGAIPDPEAEPIEEYKTLSSP